MALCRLFIRELQPSAFNPRTCLHLHLNQLSYGGHQQFVPFSRISQALRKFSSQRPKFSQNNLFAELKNTYGKRSLLNFRTFFSSSLRKSNNFLNSSEIRSKSSFTKSAAAKATSGDWKRLLGLMKPERWSLAGALLCLVLSSGVSMSVPYFIGQIIDIIYSKNSDGENMIIHLRTFCLWLGAVFFLGGLANFGRVYFLQTTSQKVVKRLREVLFRRIMKQEVGFFDKTKTGELINRLSADTSLVAQSLSQNISDGLRATFQASAGLGMMMYVSSKLTVISMGIVPPVAIASIIYGRYLRKITSKVQDSLAEATHVAEEKISNIRTVKAFAHENIECDTYNLGVRRVLDLSYQEALARAVFWGFTGFSGNIIIISVLYFGGFMMLETSISVGDLSSFLLYAAYVGASLGGLTSFYTELNRGVAASYRIWELIDRQPSMVEQSSSALGKVEGNFVFNKVFFAYPSRADQEIFSDLTMEIPARKITALVGPSGSGKSTVGALMLRFYDPCSGTISMDGHNIRDLDASFLRSQIGLVTQEPILFSASIYDNIAYGAPSPSLVSDRDVMDAAIKANAKTFIEELPHGMDSYVGQRGQLLSGGQRQRIAIARAIVRNPKVLILDEATSALDAESEFLVQDALEQLMVGRTVLIIAHRLSTIMNADNILVIDKGKLVESGCYEELMMVSGLFRRLVDRQTLTRVTTTVDSPITF